jgi:hypothetical protein
MARIPDEVVERLKAEVSVERLAEARGVELKKHGADLIGRCPFHEDKTPSLVVTPAKNLWHCLGACQAGGTVIDWVMKAEGVSFRHAVELLQNDYQPVAAAVTGAAPAKRCTVKKLAAPIRPNRVATGIYRAVPRRPGQTRSRPARLHRGSVQHHELEQQSARRRLWQPRQR